MTLQAVKIYKIAKRENVGSPYYAHQIDAHVQDVRFEVDEHANEPDAEIAILLMGPYNRVSRQRDMGTINKLTMVDGMIVTSIFTMPDRKFWRVKRQPPTRASSIISGRSAFVVNEITNRIDRRTERLIAKVAKITGKTIGSV